MPRLDYDAPQPSQLYRRALLEKYMTKTPQELMDLLNNGDAGAGTTSQQEARRMLVFCVMAVRGLLRK